MTDQLTNELLKKAAAPPGNGAMIAIAIMSVVILLFSGYVIVNYSGSKATTAANLPAQTGYTPIVDEVRRVPAPSTTGQGGERR